MTNIEGYVLIESARSPNKGSPRIILGRIGCYLCSGEGVGPVVAYGTLAYQ